MRVAVTTLGCKVNHYDSATIETRLRAAGHEVVAFEAGADVYVVNSCSVTDRADAESRQLARRARRFNDLARVVVTGCYAQTDPSGAAVPEVDHVVGLNRLDDLVGAIEGRIHERIAVNDLRTARRVETLGADVFTGQTRAFLKVQEGCDLFCTFCIVPFSRGKSRSVPPRQILDQLTMLADRGFVEVVLTGVHLGGYGEDLDTNIDLVRLVDMIVEHRPVPRLRLSSVDPPEVSPELLRIVRDADIVCPHLHIPYQAGDDGVLQRMRRKYGASDLRDLGDRLAAELPDAAIGTDVIAGFPGETDEEFDATLELLETSPVNYFHVFPYSKRSGTTAAKRTDHVPAEVIKERAQRLRDLGADKRARFAERFVGADLDVLVEGPITDRHGWMIGYSRNYQRVEVPGDASLANREVRVRIESCRDDRLVGRIAETV